MKSKTLRRLMLATLIAACLLVPLLTVAEPNSQPATFNDAYDLCSQSSDDWEDVQNCIEAVCSIFECQDIPEPTG